MSENIEICNFCGKSGEETKGLFSSGVAKAYMCYNCMKKYYNEIRKSEKTKKCSFCERPENMAKYMFSSGEYNICDDCVIYCYEMASEEYDDSDKINPKKR